MGKQIRNSELKQEFERIKKKKKKLTAKTIVQEARNKDNPLHKYFEWDDKKASEQYRLHQARVLINYVKYDLAMPDGGKKRVYQYEAIKTNGDTEYLEAHEILANEKYREIILQHAVREISGWKKKYELYSEFGSVVKEIEKVERRFEKKDGRAKRTNRSKTSSKKGYKG